MIIRPRQRKKRRDPVVKLRTTKDLLARDGRGGSTGNSHSSIATTDHTTQDSSTGWRAVHDIVIDHVLA